MKDNKQSQAKEFLANWILANLERRVPDYEMQLACYNSRYPDAPLTLEHVKSVMDSMRGDITRPRLQIVGKRITSNGIIRIFIEKISVWLDIDELMVVREINGVYSYEKTGHRQIIEKEYGITCTL